MNVFLICEGVLIIGKKANTSKKIKIIYSKGERLRTKGICYY